MNDFFELIRWSEDNYQFLPWRQKRSLYTTLVSEIMLQQTNVTTVLKYYENFLDQFPDFKTLAQAKGDDLANVWQGLGYYRRAKNLHNAAKIITERYKQKVPNDFQILKTISGIGEYTANAIISIGHNSQALALDGNLKRVLSRLFDFRFTTEKDLKLSIYQLLEKPDFCDKVNNLGWRKFNEALMDLGRTLCQVKRVNCDICPMFNFCKTKDKHPLNYPKLVKSNQKLINLDLYRFFYIKNNSILCYKKKSNQWLANQWEVPTYSLTNLENFTQYPYLNQKMDKKLLKINTFITKYSIHNYLLMKSPPKIWFEKIKNYKYINFYDIKNKKIILSTTTIKCLKKLKLIN